MRYAGEYFMNCSNENNKEAKIYDKDNEGYKGLEQMKLVSGATGEEFIEGSVLEQI